MRIHKQTNVYLLVQKNYSPVGQLIIVKVMARPTKLVAPGVRRYYLSNPDLQTSKLKKTQGFTNKDHPIIKKEIMEFSSANRDYFNIIALLKYVY